MGIRIAAAAAALPINEDLRKLLREWRQAVVMI